MRIISNILWLLFGGYYMALCYFCASLALIVTIIGIPMASHIFKLGLLCLWPFGAEITEEEQPTGCFHTLLFVLWIIIGGFSIWISHIILGCVFYITIIGIPFGKQHFKMARLSLSPFGKEVELHL